MVRTLLCLVAALAIFASLGEATSLASEVLTEPNDYAKFANRKLTEALICDDGLDDDDDFVCCPDGCSDQGQCVENRGCDCLLGWGASTTCATPMSENWSMNTLNGLIVFFSIFWGLAIIRAVIGLFLWLGKGPHLSILIGHGIAIFHTIVRFLFYAVDPFRFRGIYPVFVDRWFDHLGFSCVFGLFCILAVYWVMVMADAAGMDEDELIVKLNVPVAAFFGVALFALQLASDANTARTMYEGYMWEPFTVVNMIWGIFALLFGAYCYKTFNDNDSDSGAFKSATHVSVLGGVILCVLGIMHMAFYWQWLSRSDPGHFYALYWVTEFLWLVLTLAILYVLRPDKWEAILAKIIPGREYEEPFESGTHYNDDDLDDDDRPTYKSGRGKLGGGDTKSDATKVEYPDTSDLSLQRENSQADEKEKGGGGGGGGLRSKPNIDATSDSTRDW